MSQLFTRFDVSHRDKHNLTLNTDVRFAGVIAEDHASFALVRIERADEQIFANLNLSRAQRFGKLVQACRD